MGHPAIVDKLQKFLSKSPELNEPNVVYVLVGIRKLIEIEDAIAKYPSLNFQCDWALHTGLNRKGAEGVIQLFVELEQMRQPSGGVTKPQVQKMMDALGVDRFRSDVSSFLIDRGIPDCISTPEERWNEFLRVYGSVIENVPLTLRPAKARLLTQVVVSKTEIPEPDQQAAERFVFALIWQPTRADGQTVRPYRINFNAVPQPTPPASSSTT